jgi:hypothetical protein
MLTCSRQLRQSELRGEDEVLVGRIVIGSGT